ncbi:hypothetical protein SCA6_004999 [Theobroma cacao]
MTGRFNLSKPASTGLSSLTIDKFLKAQKNLSKPQPKLWPNDHQLQIPPSRDNQQQLPVILRRTCPILRAFESCTYFNQFNQNHTQLLKSDLLQHPPVVTWVLKKLCNSLKPVSHAVLVFDCIKEPDTLICNIVLKGFLDFDDPFGALSFYYEKMVGKLVEHNEYTLPLLLKIYAEIRSLKEGEKVHAQIRIAHEVFDDGFVLDLVTWNSMIDGFVKNEQVGVARYVGVGEMEVARELFEKMPFRALVSWNCMIDGYARIENISEARKLFDQMPVRDVVSWNIMLALYVRCKKYASQTLMLFDRMIEVRPNSASLVSILTACANLRRLDKGLWVHSFIDNN